MTGLAWTPGFRTPHVLSGNDAYTKLLLHGEGANGSTSIIDRSIAAHGAATVFGATQIDTSQGFDGGGSIKLGAVGNYISFADSADWDFSASDFTVDFRFRLALIPAVPIVLMWQQANVPASGFPFWNLTWFPASSHLQYSFEGVSANLGNYQVTFNPAINTLYHLAFVRNGSNFYIFVDGTAPTLITNTAIGTNTLENVSAPLFIGVRDTGSIGVDWMTEIRISKGVARWTANFTPPIHPYG